jgi:RNA polymerase subunit RPABC4/transcription elongation factor Spt4
MKIFTQKPEEYVHRTLKRKSEIIPDSTTHNFINQVAEKIPMNWTTEQLSLKDKYPTLEDIPVEERKYKCHTCYHVVDDTPCPACGETQLVIMCPLDHCHCTHSITETIEYCPLCGQPVCPECGSHDVSQVSRVTGYLADVAGWNQGKQQELKDRSRYTVA